MTKLKKITAIGVMVLAVSATSLTAFAASKYSSPAEAVAGLTGRTVDSVVSERSETGKTYGAIANEAGKLEEFKSEKLQIKEDTLAKKVADGTITQARADEITKVMEERQAACDGTGNGAAGRRMGAGLGHGNGSGRSCGGAGCLNK